MQRTTKNGKPIINRITKTPLYNKPVHIRIKQISKELFVGLTTYDAKWQSICNSVSTINI